MRIDLIKNYRNEERKNIFLVLAGFKWSMQGEVILKLNEKRLGYICVEV